MLNILIFMFLAFLWGGSFIAIKEVIGSLPTFSSAFYRVFFSLIFLSIFYFKSLNFKIVEYKKEIFNSSITGLFAIGIPFSLLFWGEQYVSPSLAALINGTVPLWTLIISVLFFAGKKDLTKLKLFGLVLGFIGILSIFLPKINLSGEINEVYGLIAIVFMAISYAVGINLNKRLTSKNTYILKKRNMLIQQFVSVVFLFIIVIFVDGLPKFEMLLIGNNLIGILYLSLFSTCIAFIIFYYLIESWGAVKSSTVTFFVPSFALALDHFIYNRVLDSNEIVGGVIILMSMFFLRDIKPAKILPI